MFFILLANIRTYSSHLGSSMKKVKKKTNINIKYKSHINKNGENECQAEMNSVWVQLIDHFPVFSIKNFAASLSSDVKIEMNAVK